MSFQSTVSESTLVALLAARKNKILEMKLSEPDADESLLNSHLIAYASDQVGYKTKTNKPILLSSHPDHTDDNMNLHYCTKRKIQV